MDAERKKRKSRRLKRSELPPVCRKFGRVLLRERRQRALSQVALATRSGVPQSEISALESGKYLPRLETLERLARGLGCRLSRLIARAERLH